MKYGQATWRWESFTDKQHANIILSIRKPDNIDRVEKSSYAATPFLWSYPETLSTTQVLDQFIDANIQAHLDDIQWALTMIAKFKQAKEDYLCKLQTT